MAETNTGVTRAPIASVAPVEALPELLELARIYAQLHDGLSNMIESGRLTEKEIPDDYLWLCDSLEKAVIANYALEEKGVKL